MRKVKLDLDALRIESFPTTDDAGAERGTVHAQQSLQLCSAAGTCFGTPSCIGYLTCACACRSGPP